MHSFALFIHLLILSIHAVGFVAAESPEEQEQAFLASVHNLARCTALLMKECVSK